MKISVNTLRNLNKLYGCTGEIMPNGIDELVEIIGAQLGAVEEVIDLNPKYQGIVIAKVVECDKHPNADKLSLCKIDDGGVVKKVDRDKNGYVQVVCGAPNVSKGQMVVWLPPGVTVPNSFDKEPFVLEARELRGQISNGMIASAHELGISDDHSGIVEVDKSIKTGADFAKTFGLDDYVIDIENKMFTHRPDLFGFLGVCREIAGIQHMAFKSPDWYKVSPKLPKPDVAEVSLRIKNQIPNLVPRFTAIAMTNVEVGPSPLWLQIELAKIGSRSINNIVDFTNYFMQLSSQPLHAYDADKLATISKQKSISIETRLSRKGDKLKLLNGKDITFEDNSTVLITSGDKPIGIGGVMGGSDTEVDESTTNIILECANFDMYSIRRTSMKYGLFTDAVTRFNKGQSPNQNLAVLAKIVDEIRNNASGKVASKIIDDYPIKNTNKIVRISIEFINARLGLDLSADHIQKLLENVEFDIEKTDNDDELKIIPPFWRTDIEIPEDIVEEIGRLYGYDHLPLVLPTKDMTPAPKDNMTVIKNQIRLILAKSGANELLTYSFVHGDMFEKSSQDAKLAYKLSNAISPDLQYYRLSLTPSLLDKVQMNIKSGYDEFALFEINKTHNKQYIGDDSLPKESEKLALVYANSGKTKPQESPYFRARNHLDYLLSSLGVTARYEKLAKQLTYQTSKPYELDRSAHVVDINSGVEFGIIGEFKTSVASAFKLPLHSAGFELSLTKLSIIDRQTIYKPISKYPSVEQDITLKVPNKYNYNDVYEILSKALLNIQNTTTSLTPIDIFQKSDNKSHVHMTFRYHISSYQKTLKSEEVNSMLNDAAQIAKVKLGAVRL